MRHRRQYKREMRKIERRERTEREIESTCEMVGGIFGGVIITLPILMILFGLI